MIGLKCIKFLLLLFFSSNIFAAAEDVRYSEAELHPMEIHILKQIRNISGDNISEDAMKHAIELAAQNFREKNTTEILDPNVRLGTCQIVSWHLEEVLSEFRKGRVSIDLLLYSLLLHSDASDLGHKFTAFHLKNNLQKFGFEKLANLSKAKLDFLYKYLEGWVSVRAIRSIVGDEHVHEYIEQHESSKNKKHTSYKTKEYEELNRKLFVEKMRGKTLLLAFHDGIPSRYNVRTFNTVKHLLLLEYSSEVQEWKIKTYEEEITREDRGFKVVRKNDQGRDSFVLTQESNADADHAVVETPELPQEGKDYIVVHMGNIFPQKKDFDESFVTALGFDKVNFEKMFFREKLEHLPGVLSIFHFNSLIHYESKFFENIETFQEPNSSGIQFGRKLRSFSFERNQPLYFEFYRPNIYYGDLDGNPDLSVRYSENYKHFLLKLDMEKNEDGNFHYTSGTFVKKTRICFRDSLLCLVEYRRAYPHEWKQFIEYLDPYIMRDLAPELQKFLHESGFKNELRKVWEARGLEWVEKGAKHVAENSAELLSSKTKEAIEKTAKFNKRLNGVFKTRLHNGQEVLSKIEAKEPSANALFDIFEMSRKQYIQRLLEEKRVENSALTDLIQTVMEDIGSKHILEWEDAFDTDHLWLTFTHLNILSELLGLRIYLYQVEDTADGIQFVPLNYEKTGNIIGRGEKEIHLLVSNIHFIDLKLCHIPFQFEVIVPEKNLDRSFFFRDALRNELDQVVKSELTQICLQL